MKEQRIFFLVALAVGTLIFLSHYSASAAGGCVDTGCNGKDPEKQSCTGNHTMNVDYRSGPAGTISAELRESDSCRARWSRGINYTYWLDMSAHIYADNGPSYTDYYPQYVWSRMTGISYGYHCASAKSWWPNGDSTGPAEACAFAPRSPIVQSPVSATSWIRKVTIHEEKQNTKEVYITFCGSDLPPTPDGDQEWIPRVYLVIGPYTIRDWSAQRESKDSACWTVKFQIPKEAEAYRTAHFVLTRWVWILPESAIAQRRQKEGTDYPKEILQKCEEIQNVLSEAGISFECSLLYKQGTPQIAVHAIQIPDLLQPEDIQNIVTEAMMGSVLWQGRTESINVAP